MLYAVDVDLEDSFSVFSPQYGGFEVRFLSPDAEHMVTVGVFDTLKEAEVAKETCTETLRLWVSREVSNL